MQQETSKAITTAMSIITSIAIIAILLTTVSLGRKGYSILEWNETLHDELREQNRFKEYSGELSADAVINFIATYGDTFRYTFQTDKNTIIFSWNMGENAKIKAEETVESLTGTDVTVNNNKTLSKTTLELIDLLKDDILNNRKYKLAGYNAEWQQLGVEEFSDCLYIDILIEGE